MLSRFNSAKAGASSSRPNISSGISAKIVGRSCRIIRAADKSGSGVGVIVAVLVGVGVLVAVAVLVGVDVLVGVGVGVTNAV